MNKILLKQILIMAWLLPLLAHAEVFEKTLGNGLKVIVKEDHRGRWL
jgi:hypothetical protein